jgi:hypothetical protein
MELSAEMMLKSESEEQSLVGDEGRSTAVAEDEAEALADVSEKVGMCGLICKVIKGWE